MIEILAAALIMAPQDPVETTLKFQGAGIELEGTLTVPANAKNLPAVLMMPGSGPTDRNGNQPPAIITNVLKELSDHLVKQGYVTFRFDKRPVHTNREKWSTEMDKISEFFSYENHEKDVMAAYKLLKDRSETDPQKVFVMGHSEGGMLTLSTAGRLQPAGLLLLGTPGRTMDTVLEDQITRAIDRAPMKDEDKVAMKADHRRILDALKAKPELPANVPPGLAPLYNPSTLHIIHGYLNMSPKAASAAYNGPVFIANGNMDVQVDAEKDAKLLKSYMDAREKGDTTLLLIDNASHNFKKVEKETDLGFQGPVAPQLLEGITKFLNEHSK